MLAHIFIDLCLSMVRRGLMACVCVIDDAMTVNNRQELAYPGLVATLFDMYSLVSRALEQIRRIYQFIVTGMYKEMYLPRNDMLTCLYSELQRHGTYVTPLLYAEPSPKYLVFESSTDQECMITFILL